MKKLSKSFQNINDLCLLLKTSICLFNIMCGGKEDGSLNVLRYTKFMEMAASSNKIEPEILPAT